MANLLKISCLVMLLCACSTTKISNHIDVNDVNYNYEELYLNNISFNVNENKEIQFDNENWNIMKMNLIKIHYHILKLQTQLSNTNKSFK